MEATSPITASPITTSPITASPITAFDGLTGQQAAKDRLVGLLRRGSPGHAHLFLGAPGLGKRAFARVFSKALLCVGDGRPGCACIPCKLFGGGSLGDYKAVKPSGQAQKPVISVDEARRIIDWLSIRPLYSKRKVCVVENADSMTEQAQNCLLKTLEEPPEYGVIILTAANQGMLLETVRSRCGVTRFSAYSDAELESILRNSNDFPQGKEIELISRLAGGNPGYAHELGGSESFLRQRDELIRLYCGFLDGDAKSAFLLASFLEKNRENYAQYLGMLIFWLRDIWICSLRDASDEEAKLVNGDMADILGKYRSRFRQPALLDCIERIDQTYSELSTYANYSLAINAMLFDMGDLLGLNRQ